MNWQVEFAGGGAATDDGAAGTAARHAIPAGLTHAQHAEAAGMLDRAFFAGYRSVMVWCAVSAWLGGLAVVVLLRRGDAGT